MDWKQFQEFASIEMGKHYGVHFAEKNPKGFPKRFDMVSPDERIVGDAKYLTLVHGTGLPPAKFMEIAGHMWLLEHVAAERRFLVFGNQREVPLLWIRKYGALVHGVELFFLASDGNLETLDTT